MAFYIVGDQCWWLRKSQASQVEINPKEAEPLHTYDHLLTIHCATYLTDSAYIPIASMGLVYLPAFTIKIMQMSVKIPYMDSMGYLH